MLQQACVRIQHRAELAPQAVVHDGRGGQHVGAKNRVVAALGHAIGFFQFLRIALVVARPVQHKPELVHPGPAKGPQVQQLFVGQADRHLGQLPGTAIVAQLGHQGLAQEGVGQRREHGVAIGQRAVGAQHCHHGQHGGAVDGGGVAHGANQAQQVFGLAVAGQWQRVQPLAQGLLAHAVPETLQLALEGLVQAFCILQRRYVQAGLGQAQAAYGQAFEHVAALAQVDGLAHTHQAALLGPLDLGQERGHMGLEGRILVQHRFAFDQVDVQGPAEVVVGAPGTHWQQGQAGMEIIGCGLVGHGGLGAQAGAQIEFGHGQPLRAVLQQGLGLVELVGNAKHVQPQVTAIGLAPQRAPNAQVQLGQTGTAGQGIGGLLHAVVHKLEFARAGLGRAGGHRQQHLVVQSASQPGQSLGVGAGADLGQERQIKAFANAGRHLERLLVGCGNALEAARHQLHHVVGGLAQVRILQRPAPAIGTAVIVQPALGHQGLEELACVEGVALGFLHHQRGQGLHLGDLEAGVGNQFGHVFDRQGPEQELGNGGLVFAQLGEHVHHGVGGIDLVVAVGAHHQQMGTAPGPHKALDQGQ